MTAAAITAGAPRARFAGRNRESLPSFLAALAMHGALVGWMWFAVQWHTNAAAPAVAELWVMPAPAPAPEPVPEPVAAPVAPPPAEAPPPVKPDIVVKKEPPKPKAVPQKEPVAKKDRKAKPAAHEKTVEEIIRQQQESEDRHQAEMKHLSDQARATEHGPPAVSSAGPISNEYSARVQAAVRAHLSFAVPENVPYAVYAEFVVELLPTGELATEPRLVKESGLPGYDDAARRAILRTDPFPRRDDGSVPRTLTLRLRPRDTL